MGTELLTLIAEYVAAGYRVEFAGSDIEFAPHGALSVRMSRESNGKAFVGFLGLESENRLGRLTTVLSGLRSHHEEIGRG